MKMKMTQIERINRFLDENGSISQFEAFTELGIMRLAARINDLKRMGVSIDTQIESHKNRFGETVYCTRYKRAV